MISQLLTGHHDQCISVRASRLWYYRGGLDTGEIKEIRMVLIDGQGDSIYATVPANLIATYISVIHETGVYKFGRFRVSPHPQILNPVENPLSITFTAVTVVQPVLSPVEMFPEWAYSLTSIGDLPEPHDTPPRLVDVIGVIRAISPIVISEVNGTNIPVSRRCVILADSSGHEIKINLFGDAAFRFNGQVIHYHGQEELGIAVFVGMTVHSRDGISELAGASACRWYINVDIAEINILRAELMPTFEPIAPLPAPDQIIRREQVDGFYPTRALATLLNHDFYQNKDGMFRCTVQVSGLTPGRPWWFLSCTRCRRESVPNPSSSAQPGGNTCSDIGCGWTEATMQYRLHVLGSDRTGEAEFNLFGRIARSVIGTPAHQVVFNNYQGPAPIINLAVAASQIIHTPPEIAAAFNAPFKFFVYVGSADFEGNMASFPVLAVERL